MSENIILALCVFVSQVVTWHTYAHCHTGKSLKINLVINTYDDMMMMMKKKNLDTILILKMAFTHTSTHQLVVTRKFGNPLPNNAAMVILTCTFNEPDPLFYLFPH